MSVVHVPGLGDMPKGAVVAIGVGGTVVVFLAYRHYKNAAASASVAQSSGSATPAASTADTSDDSEIDPMTGYPVGSAADEQALADTGYSTGLDAGYPIGDSATEVDTSAPSTNAAWSQYVQQTLTSIGYDSETVAGAIGAYLAKLPLTATQASIVQVALAECGTPPQGSYSIVQQSTPGTTTTTTTSAATVTVPSIVGDDVTNASSALQSLGLKMTPEPAAVKGKVHTVTSQSPKAGSKVAVGSTVTIQYKTS